MSPETHYWLTIASSENCALLAEMNYPYFALGSIGATTAKSIVAGDRCILYRSRQGKGFIGLFEVTSDAEETTTAVGSHVYTIRIPWKAELLCENRPVDLPAVAPALEFIKNKRMFGTYLQTTLRRLSSHDFSVIKRELIASVRAQDNQR